MEIRRVEPETTDVLMHADEVGRRAVRHQQRPRRERHEEGDDLVFGAIPKSTLGIISLVLLFAMALIFGVKELEISIPVYLIVLVVCTAMGLLLSGAPGFVSVLVSALLIIVGAITAKSVDYLFPAVALGVAMLVSASLIMRRE